MESENLTIIEQLEKLRITSSSEIPPHEFLYTWNGVPCFARGELVAVTGKAKSGKTYLNSILMAAAGVQGTESGESHSPEIKERSRILSGTTDKAILGLKRIRDKPLRVVWIDTEQSADSTHEILRDRIGAMMGAEASEEAYHVFNLRQVRWQDRMTLVLAAIAICVPDLVIFDGIRDVVGDINNYEEAQNTIGQLLKVASEYKTCIVCVLHQNKAAEDKTLRGALGTELQNKSFETYECKKDPETRIFSIQQTATRKYDMSNKIQFCVDKEGLPVQCAENSGLTSEAQDKEKQGGGFNGEYVGADGKIDKAKLFGYILQGGSLAWNDLRTKLMQTAHIRSVHFAETLMQEARDGGLMQTLLINGRREYLLQRQQKLFDEDT
jgi:hypothetical protein